MFSKEKGKGKKGKRSEKQVSAVFPFTFFLFPSQRAYSPSSSPPAAPPPAAPPAGASPSRPSRIFLRTACAADLISCIFLRTRVPAALFPPMALATSSSASATRRLSVSYSVIMFRTSKRSHGLEGHRPEGCPLGHRNSVIEHFRLMAGARGVN